MNAIVTPMPPTQLSHTRSCTCTHTHTQLFPRFMGSSFNYCYIHTYKSVALTYRVRLVLFTCVFRADPLGLGDLSDSPLEKMESLSQQPLSPVALHVEWDLVAPPPSPSPRQNVCWQGHFSGLGAASLPCIEDTTTLQQKP